MAYVAVTGGERAIDAAHDWLAQVRRGDPGIAEIGTGQILSQLGRAVDRVMAEGSCHDPDLAALAIKQAQGDLIEAAFLLRAYRTTLPRFAASLPLDTGAMRVRRRISAIYKDLPGGQVLGPTYDYTHRLLDFSLAVANGHRAGMVPDAPAPVPATNGAGQRGLPDEVRSLSLVMPPVMDVLDQEGLMERSRPNPTSPGLVTSALATPGDLTREPLCFPAARDVRLQSLARGDEGFLLALGYSTQRGYGNSHPFVGELRVGDVAVEIVPPELGFPIEIGTVTLTECEMVNQFAGSLVEPAQFTRGYGLCFGHGERRAMAMALVDRALRATELGEEPAAPAQDIEFVISHCDNIEATGFVEHLKLPHYVDFQSELETIRRMRKTAAGVQGAAIGEVA